MGFLIGKDLQKVEKALQSSQFSLGLWSFGGQTKSMAILLEVSRIDNRGFLNNQLRLSLMLRADIQGQLGGWFQFERQKQLLMHNRSLSIGTRSKHSRAFMYERTLFHMSKRLELRILLSYKRCLDADTGLSKVKSVMLNSQEYFESQLFVHFDWLVLNW